MGDAMRPPVTEGAVGSPSSDGGHARYHDPLGSILAGDVRREPAVDAVEESPVPLVARDFGRKLFA
jgi:hypothetical protein